MGKPRKIESPELMAQLWEEYKNHCDSQTVIKTEFSSKEGRFIEGVVKKPITATSEGFCVYVGLTRSKFYETYCNDESYGYIVSRMREESEQDVRNKFENGTLPTQLSGLWMSRYENYSLKQDLKVNEGMSKEDRELLEKVNKRLEAEKEK